MEKVHTIEEILCCFFASTWLVQKQFSMFSSKVMHVCFFFLIDIYIPEKSPSVAVKTSKVLEDRHELRVVFTAMSSLLSLWLRLCLFLLLLLLLC